MMNQQGQFKWPTPKPTSSQQPTSPSVWSQQPVLRYLQPQQTRYNPPIAKGVPSPYAAPLWPQGDHPIQQQAVSTPLVHYSLPLPKTGGRRVFKVTLYFLGVLLAEVGIVGSAFYAFNKSVQAGGVGLLVGLCAAIGSGIIFFRKHYHRDCLPWGQSLWWTLAATLGAMIALGCVFGFLPRLATMQLVDASASCTLTLYGSVLVWITHLEPSLRPGTFIRALPLKAPQQVRTVPSVPPHASPFIRPMPAPITPFVQPMAKEVITPPPGTTSAPTSLGLKEALAVLSAQREAAKFLPKQVPTSPHVHNGAVHSIRHQNR